MTTIPLATTSGDWFGVERLLAVRLDALGDVLMTTPALRAIRRSLPEAHIALLTSPAGAEAGRRVPELDEVIVHRAGWMKAAAEGGSVESLPALAGRLAEGRFDAAVIFTVFSQSPFPSAVACHLARISRVLAHVRENPYALVSDWVRDPEWPVPTRHEVQRQLDLVGAVGFTTDDEHLSYRVSPDASRRVRAMLASLGVGGRDRFVVVHPGATASSRRYRPEGFAEAAAHLAAEDDARILITGSVDEAPLTARVAAAVPGAVDLAGRLDTDELGALIAIAPLLISNNTGPAHMAAAVGTPVVVLYAQTNLQHAPWGVASRVLTRDVPCHDCLRSICPLGHHACLAPVQPSEIVEAARELLGWASASRPVGPLERGAGKPPLAPASAGRGGLVSAAATPRAAGTAVVIPTGTAGGNGRVVTRRRTSAGNRVNQTCAPAADVRSTMRVAR